MSGKIKAEMCIHSSLTQDPMVLYFSFQKESGLLRFEAMIWEAVDSQSALNLTADVGSGDDTKLVVLSVQVVTNSIITITKC